MMFLKIMDYLLLFNSISLIIAEIFTDNIDYPTNYVELVGMHTIYNIFTNTMSWNEARAFCRSIGSDLSKVPNEADVSAMGQENKDVKKFFEKNYFTSAVRPTSDLVHWTSDCSYDTSEKGGPYELRDTFNTSTCLEYHRDHFHNFKNCSVVGNPFLCERKYRVPCTISTILDTEVVILSDMDESNCNEACTDDVTCWGTIVTQQQCIKVVIPGYGLSSLSFATKRCATFEARYNSTWFSLPAELITDDLQRSDPPISSCDDQIVSSSISPTFPTPHSNEPPDVLISTHTVTSTLFTTLHVTSTQFTTLYVTSTQFTTLHVTRTQQVVGPTVEITVSDPFTVTVTASASPQIDPTCVASTPETETTSIISTSRIDATPVLSTSQISSSGIDSITTSPVHQILVISVSSTIDDHTDLRTIDVKNTSTYRRSVTSAKDNRRTSIFIGVTAAALVIIPLWVIIIMDIKTIFQHLCDHRTIYIMR